MLKCFVDQEDYAWTVYQADQIGSRQIGEVIPDWSRPAAPDKLAVLAGLFKVPNVFTAY